jgi:hypothetical protein
MNQKRVKLLCILGLSAAFVGVAVPAAATNVNQGYNLVMPGLQVQVVTGQDLKTITNHYGFISVAFVGASYKANAVMCSLGGAYCGGGTKVHDLVGGSNAQMPNVYGAGGKIVTGLTTSSFTAYSVQTTGKWCAF